MNIHQLWKFHSIASHAALIGLPLPLAVNPGPPQGRDARAGRRGPVWRGGPGSATLPRPSSWPSSAGGMSRRSSAPTRTHAPRGRRAAPSGSCCRSWRQPRPSVQASRRPVASVRQCWNWASRSRPVHRSRRAGSGQRNPPLRRRLRLGGRGHRAAQRVAGPRAAIPNIAIAPGRLAQTARVERCRGEAP